MSFSTFAGKYTIVSTAIAVITLAVYRYDRKRRKQVTFGTDDLFVIETIILTIVSVFHTIIL